MCDAVCWDDDAARFAFCVGSTATVTHTMLPKFEGNATARIKTKTTSTAPARRRRAKPARPRCLRARPAGVPRGGACRGPLRCSSRVGAYALRCWRGQTGVNGR